MKYNFLLNENGYIDGYSKDLFDSGGVELTDEQVASIVLGSTKYTDGQLVIDTEHQKAIEDAEEKLEEEAKPVDYQAIIAQLKLEQEQTNEALLEISDMLLADTSTSTTTEGTK